MAEEDKTRISNLTATLMISVAVIIDLIDALLGLMGIGVIINSITAAIWWLLYFIWFKLHGISFLGKTAVRYHAGLLFELIPVLNTLPLWSVAVAATIASIRLEDKTGISLAKPRASLKRIRSLRQARIRKVAENRKGEVKVPPKIRSRNVEGNIAVPPKIKQA